MRMGPPKRSKELKFHNGLELMGRIDPTDTHLSLVSQELGEKSSGPFGQIQAWFHKVTHPSDSPGRHRH